MVTVSRSLLQIQFPAHGIGIQCLIGAIRPPLDDVYAAVNGTDDMELDVLTRMKRIPLRRDSSAPLIFNLNGESRGCAIRDQR